MWRRSLGGRAHPLAPALSAALQKLSGLTNLAVDGKFSQLAVVSSLTNLRQLASAAPLSKEGWQVVVVCDMTGNDRTRVSQRDSF